MTYSGVLEMAAQWAAIFTALVAVVAYGGYLLDRGSKRRRLEKYLEREKKAGRDQGQRTILHLVARLGMSEAQIMDAAFRSRHIRRVVGSDSKGRADVLLLEYMKNVSD